MLNRTGVIFCTTAFAAAMAACAVGYRLAALPEEVVIAAKTPAPPEKLPPIELPDFGKVEMIELVGYYLENPPAPAEAGAPGAGGKIVRKRFGGC